MARSPRGYLYQQFIPGAQAPSAQAMPIRPPEQATPAEQLAQPPKSDNPFGKVAESGALGGTANYLAGTGTGEKVTSNISSYYKAGGALGAGVSKIGDALGIGAKKTDPSIQSQIDFAKQMMESTKSDPWQSGMWQGQLQWLLGMQ